MSHYKPYSAYKDSGVEWLGRVPEHWSISQMKSGIKSLQNGVWGDEPTGGPDDVPCARVADFDRVRLIADEPLPTLRSIPSEQRAYKNVRPGDLLLEKSGGGEQTTVGAMVQYIGASEIVCSNFVAAVKCNEGVSARWLCYVNSYLYSLGVNTRSIKQTTGIQNLDSNQYTAEPIAFPTYGEQKAIAAHLDRETTRIDALITKKTRFIELLREKRQALITHAVTKGLDPNVKMKDSGVEWLGEVPEHWGIHPMKWSIERNDGGVWGDDPDGEYDTLVLRSTEQTVDGNWRIDDPAYRKLSPSDRDFALLNAGDLLVTKSSGSSSHIGKTSIVTDEVAAMQCCYSNFMQRIRLKQTFAPKLAWYIMNNQLARNQFAFLASTTTGLANLNGSMIGSLLMALPPSNEQQTIVTHLDRETARIDATIKISERSIELLKERRSALITAAVTGQIDLREAS